jgi:hypothetical protein
MSKTRKCQRNPAGIERLTLAEEITELLCFTDDSFASSMSENAESISALVIALVFQTIHDAMYTERAKPVYAACGIGMSQPSYK